jgi:hypothetical protein
MGAWCVRTLTSVEKITSADLALAASMLRQSNAMTNSGGRNCRIAVLANRFEALHFALCEVQRRHFALFCSQIAIRLTATLPGGVSIGFAPNSAKLKKSYQTALWRSASTRLSYVVHCGIRTMRVYLLAVTASFRRHRRAAAAHQPLKLSTADVAQGVKP